MRQMIIVEPSSTSRSRALARNSSSVSTHASVTAWRNVSSVNDGFAAKHFWRFLGNQSMSASTQRLPEWPSKTQKPIIRWPPGASNWTFIMYRSSCTSLFPCQVAAPTDTCRRPTCVSWVSDSFKKVLELPRSDTCWCRLISSFSCTCPYSPTACRNFNSSVVRWPCASSSDNAFLAIDASTSWICRRTPRIAWRNSSFFLLMSSSCLWRFFRCKSDSCLCLCNNAALWNFLLHRKQMKRGAAEAAIAAARRMASRGAGARKGHAA
mmetsp:Transcript_76528/g.234244  ORF Transcript_76528/g.234244 Transcript_76528/m.234244 type:complete len:266 (-) Transcript_76528:80-877(-)